jgi:predicted oxidoreductase
MAADADVIVIGAGLAGIVAATEAAAKGKRVLVVEQESPANLGGQAHWSLGGLFFVNSPEQRRLGIADSRDRALADWLNAADFDRPEDHWPRKWAEAYVDFAAGEKRPWLRAMGMRWFPVVGWAERGRNSVPRFHITWGTGPGVLAPFLRRLTGHEKTGRIAVRYRHRVDSLSVTNGAVDGVSGTVLAPADHDRGKPTNRDTERAFSFHAPAVIVASGGIGGDIAPVRANWPPRLGTPPGFMVQGVPDHVDGRMVSIAEAAGARVINRDRMWHYTEGLRNFAPVWSGHGIRILPGPSSLWLDALGNRLPAPLFPGFDTLDTLAHIMATGFDYSWFILNQSIVKREFALSGSEQNPDLTGKSWRLVLRRALGKKAAGPVEAFKDRGADFIVRDNLRDLVAAMNALTGDARLDPDKVERIVRERDAAVDDPTLRDPQLEAIRAARAYIADRLVRVARPHRILDPRHGPLIAVKLNILTRKTLGGLETDLSARVFGHDGRIVGGLYAVGEAAGFGGGGMHGYRSLEGTFLGGCIFSGRVAGRAAAGDV